MCFCLGIENFKKIYETLEKVCHNRARRRRPANQEQAKHALTHVIIFQLAPRNSNAARFFFSYLVYSDDYHFGY